jgi:hypothetical protein
MEFTIKGNVYRTGKLDAFTQLHIVRRLTPCIGKLAALAGGSVKLKYGDDGKVVDIDGDPDAVLTPLANAITAMSDEDVEYVFNACIEVTERKQAGGAWAALRVKGTTMFDGLTLPVLMQIAYYVVRENLTDFFGELPSLSGPEGFLKAKGLVG